MRQRFLVLAAACVLAAPVLAQPNKSWAPVSNTTLAQDYARRGEHEKVVFLFEKLSAEEQTSLSVFPVYLTSLQALKRHKDAEKLAKKAVKLRPEDPTMGVTLGGVYAAAGDAPAADKQWTKVVNQLTPPQVLAETLRLIAQDEKQLPFVRNMLQNALREEKDFDALEKQLLGAIQQHPDQAAYSELLLWLQVQRRDFGGALMQARALDRRGRGEGRRVMELASIALQNKDYESAIEAYAYVTKEYRAGPYGNMARQRLLQAREAQVRNTYPVDVTKVRALVGEYEQLLAELGRTPDTAPVLRNLANLHAFQLNDRPKAMTLLQEVIDMPRSSEEVVDEAKVTLGDLYLLKEEPWEATLLYSQVEKSHKDSPLGYEAKLRNARLSYYAGDFKLAQSHLDILKEATTREIANDAMQLSLLIQDNTVEDTLGLGLKAFAAVEQLVFQNKLKEAITALDALQVKFPGHSLGDDVHYLKGQLQRRMGDFAGATATLERITNNPKYDVLSDDALFLLARIQEEDLKDKDKAQSLYNLVITKYPGSIYVAEARKRFRKLRGDGV